jgi:uncharacterized membrane protein
MFISSLLSNEDSCVVATHRLLQTMMVPVTRTALSGNLHEHPDYPSLLSVSDVLKDYKVDNISLRTNLEQVLQLPAPFLVQLKATMETPYENFTVVRKVRDGLFDIYNVTDNKWSLTPAATFARKWTGIVLLPEAAEESGEKDYVRNVKDQRRSMAVTCCTLLALPVISLAASLVAFYQAGSQAIYPATYLLLALTGAGLTSLLLWYELDKYNPLLQKICSAGKKVNCTAVLESKGAKIGGIGWSTIGFTYFTGILLTLLFSGVLQPRTLSLLAWLNIAALPYVFFSVYYQWRVAKQWCILCLCVQGILVLQFLTALAAGWLAPISGIFTENNVVGAVLAFLLPFIVITILLPVYRDRKEDRLKIAELLRLKHNPGIFGSFLATQKLATDFADDLGIVLGNPDAPNKIIKVCNPYCGPCAKSHAALHDLIRDSPDIQVRIIFAVTNNKSDKASPVKHFLAIAGKNDETTLKQALDDWYLAPSKDYDAFAAKYPMNGELKAQDSKVEAMREWCNRMEISSTPAFYVSLSSMRGEVQQAGFYELPQMYSIGDLKYFLSL